MPALTNKRHETFSQMVATGYSKREAYRIAGYKDNRGNAALLSKRLDIQARIKELKEMNFQLAKEVKEQIKQEETERIELSKKWVLDRLIENAVECIRINQRSAANRALELLGKELGMFIDRSEVHTTSELSKLSDQELIEKLKEEMLLTIDHEPMNQEPDSLDEESGSEDPKTIN